MMKKKYRIWNVCSDKIVEFRLCTPQMNYSLTSIPIKIELTIRFEFEICFIYTANAKPPDQFQIKKKRLKRALFHVWRIS